MRKTILFPRKRIASRALQEKSQVKTRCVRIGSTRLYAPMVPLAPHPCVRWWNTEEMPLKLTHLGLHSLRGGSSHQKPSHPVGAGVLTRPACFSPENHPPRRRGYQRTGNGIPPTQRQWRKGDHGSLKPGPPKTEKYPKGFYPRDNQAGLVLCAVVSHLPIISTGLPFLFRSPEPLFLLRCKRKSGFGPSRAGKKQLQDKTHHFPTKEKTVLPAPSVKRHSTHRARVVSKRHNRQETACPQCPGGGPSRASEKTIPSRAGKKRPQDKHQPNRPPRSPNTPEKTVPGRHIVFRGPF